MAGVPIVDRVVCTALAVAHGRVSASGGCCGAVGRGPELSAERVGIHIF